MLEDAAETSLNTRKFPRAKSYYEASILVFLAFKIRWLARKHLGIRRVVVASQGWAG